MSLVIAVRKDDVVYFGSDSQLTSGTSKNNHISPDNMKITKLKNNVLIAGVGDCRTSQYIKRSKVLRDLLENNKITKEFLVNKYIPVLIEELEKEKLLLIKDNDIAEYGSTLLISQNDNLFIIKDTFLVFEIEKYVSVGSAQDFTLPGLLNIDYSKDLTEQMLDIFHLTSKYDSGISSPFYFINTKENEFVYKE